MRLPFRSIDVNWCPVISGAADLRALIIGAQRRLRPWPGHLLQIQGLSRSLRRDHTDIDKDHITSVS